MDDTAVEDGTESRYTAKIETLRAELRSLPGAVVAFSGGVDSAMLLHASRSELGDRVLAVTADSPSLPRCELLEAEEFASDLGIEHQIIRTRELEREEYLRNASDRCFFCKTELFDRIGDLLKGVRDEVADRARWPVLYGAIADDLTDHRPGAAAAAQHGVLAPLAAARLAKDEVRRYSREHGLSTADKPSFACLASRIPYGTRVSAGVLEKLERAEQVLRDLGYQQFRVRHHGTVARVELLPEDFSRAVTMDRTRITEGVRAAGYNYVSLDLNGYRTGSMNEVIS